MRTVLRTLTVILLLATPALAMHPGTTVVVPAASRGEGVGGSRWATSLYLFNPNPSSVEVTIAWLVRNQANPEPATATRTLAGGASLVFDDALQELFTLTSGNGAFRITAPQPVVAIAGIFNRGSGMEYGQGFEGIPVTVAIAAGQSTHSLGIANNSTYRTNFFAVDVSGSGSTVLVEVLDPAGQVVGSSSYQLGGWQPVLQGLSGVVATPVDAGVVRFTVQSGAALVGASRVNMGTGDPLTLPAWWECGGGDDGLAPRSLAGLSLDLVVTPNECGMAPFTEPAHAEVTSDTEATITVYGADQTIPIASYTAAGDLSYIETELPEWDITDTWLTMVWATASSGRFTGAATDYNGAPIQFSGTFEVVAR